MKALSTTNSEGFIPTGVHFTAHASVTPPGDGGFKLAPIDKVSLLFLDIDGVLNSHKIQVLYGNLAGSDEDGIVSYKECTDLMAAGLINKVCESTGALIVLSSAWRVGVDLHNVPFMLQNIGINKDLVIGKTDNIRTEQETYNDLNGLGKDNRVRGNQIQRFLDNIATKEGREYLIKHRLLDRNVKFEDKVVVQSYAIVDDDSDMLESQKANFVNTTFMDGLTCALAIELGKILSNDETYYLNRLSGGTSVGANWESKFQ